MTGFKAKYKDLNLFSGRVGALSRAPVAESAIEHLTSPNVILKSDDYCFCQCTDYTKFLKFSDLRNWLVLWVDRCQIGRLSGLGARQRQ